MDMGQRIKNTRIAKGFKQEYVAEALGVSRQAVSKWETGQTQPDTKNLIALAKLLDVTVDYLAQETAPAAAAASSKSRTLRRSSVVLFVFSTLIWCVGFFSGTYSTMLFLPVSDAISIGIPLIWYGKTTFALFLKMTQLAALVLSLLLRTIAWAIQQEKQALA